MQGGGDSQEPGRALQPLHHGGHEEREAAAGQPRQDRPPGLLPYLAGQEEPGLGAWRPDSFQLNLCMYVCTWTEA